MESNDNARKDPRSQSGTIGALVAVVAFLVFYLSPVQKMGDSEFTVLLSEQVLLHQSFELDEYFWPNAPIRFYPGMRPGMHWPRQVQPNGHRRAERRGVTEGPLTYIYPHGTSVLSLPLVAAARVFGLSAIAPDGGHDPVGERRVQRLAASTLMALVCTLFFVTARLVLPVRWSLLVSLSGGLGTQIWSTASRSLQSHTWDIVLLAFVCYALLGALEGRLRFRPILLASLFSWSFFVRPTAVFYIVPLTFFVAATHRRHLLALLATGAVWLGLFLLYSQRTFGEWLPDYYTRGSGLWSKDWATGLSGQLISPSRGLFVFVPLVLFVAYLLVAYRAELRHRSLVAAAAGAVGLHIVVMGTFRNWWGGYCYGPRFSSDLVPLFVLLGCLGTRALLDRHAKVGGNTGQGRSTLRRRLETAAFAAALGIGMLLNGAGAMSRGGEDWNLVPVAIGDQPERCFDWRRSQWWCALFPSQLPDPEPGSRYDFDSRD